MITFTLQNIFILKELFTARANPKEIFARATEIMMNPDAPYNIVHDEYAHGDCMGAMLALATDGADSVGAQGSGLFNPTRSRTVSDFTFGRFHTLELQTTMMHILERYAALFPQYDGRITVFPFPPDSAQGAFMMQLYGAAAYGAATWLSVRVLPTQGNLDRLPAILIRAFIQSVRALAQPDVPFTLAEALVTEGLAACFVEQQTGRQQPYHVGFLPPHDWPETVLWLAEQHQQTDYLDLRVNLYGHMIPLRDYIRPLPVPLDAQELAYSTEVIMPLLNTMTAAQIAACMYGDSYVAPFGLPCVGLSPLAGFEVAYHLVRAALDRQNLSIQDAVAYSAVRLLSGYSDSGI